MSIGNIEEVLDCIEQGVYDFCKDGKCSGCGNCCTNLLLLSDKEIFEIKCYIKKHGIKEQVHKFNFLAEAPLIDLTCPFMDDSKKDKKCTIYEVRPEVCRKFQCNVPPSTISDEWKAQFAKTHIPCKVRETFYAKR